MKRLLLAAVLLTTSAFAQDRPPPAEDPLPLIQEAEAAWQAGEIAHARRALEQATRSVAAKHVAALRAFLPAPFDGWTVNDSEAAEASMLVLGGGITLDRTYSNDTADVRIEILADSDLVEQLTQMYGDPQTVAATGMTTETIGGATAIVEPGGGKYLFFIDNRTMVSVDGSAAADVRKSYAENIDFAGLRSLK
ncbi:MAG: hypothetical protein QM698_04510 [Micropepsaceae bacterium]